MRRAALSVAGLAIGILLGLAASARADEPTVGTSRESEWSVSVLGAGGLMVTDDQRNALHFSAGGGSVRLGVHARPFATLGIDWLEGELRGGVSLVGPGQGELGGIVDLQLGARVAPRFDDVRPYLAVGVGLAFTGPLVRALGSATLGVALQVSREVTIGPEVSVLHVIQDDGPFQSDDALFLTFGLSLTYRYVTYPPVVPDVETRVVDRTIVVTRTRERPAPPPPPPGPPVVMEDLLSLVDLAVPGSSLRVVVLVPPILFDHDQSALTAAGEVAMHDVLERVAAADPSARIVIEGHADLTGDPDHNLVLSRARAATVSAWLVAHGVSPERIRESGEGDTAPLVIGEDDATLAPNRRVTIRIESELTGPPSTEESP